MMSSKRVIVGAAHGMTEDLLFLNKLIEAETISSVIDRCYPLEQIAEAHRYVETGPTNGTCRHYSKLGTRARIHSIIRGEVITSHA